MPRILTDENFPLPVVVALRSYGYDVVTVFELGKANQEWPDGEVFREAIAQSRILLTKNRRDFYKLHCAFPMHYGVVACTDDSDFERAAANVHKAIQGRTLQGRYVRVYRQS